MQIVYNLGGGVVLSDDIIEIREGLKTGRFPSEASVCQGIVLRILNALAWPTYDTRIVAPEYPIEGTRVDFALCHPPGKPVVFIEVKQVGQASGAEWQLFQYAFHKGVPMAVLTDGAEWQFFLPAEQGDYGERQVYKLDLAQREIDDATSRLQRYLDYAAITSGLALESARADYRDAHRQRLVKSSLPDAWSRLVDEEDESLVDLIANKTETLCGYKPEPDAIIDFLRGIAAQRPVKPQSLTDARSARETSSQARLRAVPRPPRGYTKPGFILLGRHFPSRNARDVMIG